MTRRQIEQLTWKDATPPRRLCFFDQAPGRPGIYELGQIDKALFRAKYLGRSGNLSLRIQRHFTSSHISEVKNNSDNVWFRCIALPSDEDAKYLEGHYLAAYREEYEWNRRHEWTQMFALDYP